jgi:hypothetical protein
MGVPMLLSLLIAAQAAALPLPDHLTIPDGHSTVICPNVAAATTMLQQHYRVKPAPNNHGIDTDAFFAGLKATGCSQDSPLRKGDVIIQSVVTRISLPMADGDERYIVYRGVNKVDGTPLTGIVSEDGNNGFARTKLAEWLVGRSSDGWLDARGNVDNGLIFYRCDTPAQAKSVVDQLKGKENAPSKGFNASLKKLASAQKCRPASDRYFVTQILSEAGNNCGFECYVSLTALGAMDRSGMAVGLVYDASLM